MCAISQALVSDCVSDIFIPFLCVCPSLRHRNNIKVTHKLPSSIRHTHSSNENRERYRSIFVCVRASMNVYKGIDTAGIQDPD